MPGEEGYPAYLGSRLASFYERAGMVRCIGTEDRSGVLTAIGAVSPPGGDLSDPVAQATLRIVQVFWSLDSDLAYRRHFPAINWLTSYSLYQDKVDQWMNESLSPDFKKLRTDAVALLQDESELEEIVRLVGQDSLSEGDQLKLEAARSLREDFLHQNSFDEIDTFTSLNKQFRLLSLIMNFYYQSKEALEHEAEKSDIVRKPVRDAIARFKYVKEDDVNRNYDLLMEQVSQELADLTA